MEEQKQIRIAAPEADLDSLSACEPTVDSLASWLMSLPMANTADTAAQVRQTTYELARLRVSGKMRLTLLEQIRPIVNYLCARMDRSAGTSNTHGDAIARLAQRLQTNLCSGYKAVVVELLAKQGDDKADQDLLRQAIHRALSDLSRTLLRTLQFYVAPADKLWLELNQLYLLAERMELADFALEDPENHHSQTISPKTLYLRAMLLATCKPNQLRPRQLQEIFNCLEVWATQASIETSATDALFAVDLESDQGPKYSRLLTDAVEARRIRTETLVYELESHSRNLSTADIVPASLSEGLVRHLADAWGMLQPRSQQRANTSLDMKLCVGIRAAHYFLSGGVAFPDQTASSDTLLHRELNPFLLNQEKNHKQKQEAAKDVWDDAFDLRVRIPENPDIADPDRILLQGYARNKLGGDVAADAADGSNAYRVYDATATDTSPGGYRLQWNDPLPANLQTGELAALREESDNRWCVGVIRWIRQDRDGTSMGIELLSPRAIPVAVRIVQKRGGPTDYARALMLPELAPINQPATLITPLVPFQAGQKVHIHRQGIQSTAQLQESQQHTESFNQFTFRLLAGYLENTQVTLKMADQ